MLQINTTPGLIGINIVQGRQSIQQPMGKQEISQPKAELYIEKELPKVIIDQYQCFAEAGLKKPIDLAKDNSQWSYECFLEGIAMYNEEGNMMAKIENGANPLPSIGENRAFPRYDFNIDFIPKSRPKIDVTGYLKIDWNIKKPIINYEVRKPTIDFQRGKVEIFMRQWPSIEINYIDEKY
jgi:hypothetical protein